MTKTKIIEMKTYWFRDYETGEDFFVEDTRLEKAEKTAKRFFKKPSFCMKVTEEEAEMMGFDTY